MDAIVKLLLRVLVDWIYAHPESAFSKFMLKPRGPRSDVVRMNRIERLASALGFLLWGAVFVGLWMLVAYLTFEMHTLPHESVLVGATLFGLAILAGCGLLGGLYLLLRCMF